MIETVTAQCGTSAVRSTQTTSIVAGSRSKSRCANTVPTSVALVPRAHRAGAVEASPTRASSPARAGHDRVREQADAERREDVSEARLRLGGSACPTVSRQESERGTRRDDVEEDGEHDPAPDDELEGVDTLPHSGPRHQIAATAPRRRPPGRHRRAASRSASQRPALTLRAPLRPRCRSRSRTRARAARRSSARRSSRRRAREQPRPCLPPRLVLDEPRTPPRRARRIVRRDRDGRLRRQHLAVAGDVRRDDRKRARERPREHHAEALLPDRWRDERLRAEQRAGQLVLAEEPDDVDPVVGHAKPREEKPYRQRIGARDGQPKPRPRADLGPRPQQHLQPLPRLLAPGEDDPVLAAAGGRRRPGRARRSGSPRTRRAAIAPATPSPARRRRCGGRSDRS